MAYQQPSSLKSRFTRGFLQALKKINRQELASSRSPREIFKRYITVKTTADKSLARVVGSRRAWSRAILCKIRNQARSKHRHASARRRTKRHQPKRISASKMNKKISMNSGDQEVGEAGELRKLVPGGEAMDLCRLLEEAAHYIKCLNTQVQVMRSIADIYST